MSGALGGQIRRELLLLARSRTDVLNPLVFLFLTVLLFALALDGRPENLRAHAAGVLWALVLLTNMLALDGMFRRDYDDGSLEQMFLITQSPVAPVLGKLLVQWLATGALITLCSPLLGLALNLPAKVLPMLFLAFLAGSPAVSFIGAIGASVTVGIRRSGAILGLLVLPMLIPVLIFGVSVVNRALDGDPPGPAIYWLAALSVASIMAAPFAVSAGLKVSLEQ
ncbi:MAG: heme exporter protein CcmB [Pseudomonadales bacterium]|nr:heme exporter protein CcmB [Pseudomonadales bacterium]MCP5183153.1 heme exporter protein CcmB [Pseudomonadales bacterium]